MKAEFSRLVFGEHDADETVAAHPEWFIGAHQRDPRPGHIDYYGPQYVGVHIVEPAQGSDPVEDGVVVVPRSYQDTFAPLSEGEFDHDAKRDQVIANVLGKIVVGVDTPGFGMNPDARSNIQQMVYAVTGSMAPHSLAQMAAIRDALKQRGIYDPALDHILNMQFIGYSMGNIAITDMQQHLSILGDGVKVEGLSFVEAVNDQNHALLGAEGLLPAIGREMSDEVMNRYLTQNERHDLSGRYDREVGNHVARDAARDGLMKSAISHGMAANLSIGAGMWRGWAPRLVGELRGPQYSGTKIRLLRTNGSHVARQQQNAHTTVQLAEAGLDTHMYTVYPAEGEPDHRHPFWQSLPMTAALLHEIQVTAELPLR